MAVLIDLTVCIIVRSHVCTVYEHLRFKLFMQCNGD